MINEQRLITSMFYRDENGNYLLPAYLWREARHRVKQERLARRRYDEAQARMRRLSESKTVSRISEKAKEWNALIGGSDSLPATFGMFNAKNPNTEKLIIRELTITVSILGTQPDLLSILKSYGALADEEVLEQLKEWNRENGKN